MGALVAFGTSQLHFAIPSRVPLAVPGSAQLVAGSARRHVEGADVVHRLETRRDHGVSLRRTGNRRAWPRRSTGCGGILQPGRGAQSRAEQGAIRRAPDVAPNHSTGAKESFSRTNTILFVSRTARTPARNPLW